ncbi:FAD/NAD-P-binding domain-containing protein, partial [Obba rivulosa]
QRTSDLLPIHFVILGGGIAGLSGAIALRRAGHAVTLLDEGETFDETPLGAGCRIPPSITKVLYRWGMETQMTEFAIQSRSIVYSRCEYDSGSVVSGHEWEEEVMNQTGGGHLLAHYADVRKMLYDAAVELGTKIRTSAKISSVSLDISKPSVTLESGDVIEADIIVGADGHSGPTRAAVLADKDSAQYMNSIMYNSVIPAEDILADPELAEFVQQKGTVFTWYSEDYGVMGFQIQRRDGREEFALQVYAPSTVDEGITRRPADTAELLEALKGAEPRLQKLAALASFVARVPVVHRPHLEDWVHRGGKLIVIGQAAHPLLPGSLYTPTMAAGDAMVLGRIFSYLHRPEQTQSFLSATQELRQRRVAEVQNVAQNNIFAMALPPGVSDTQDHRARARSVASVEALTNSNTTPMKQQAVKDMFAYDPEEDADDWWVKWGLVEERAARTATSDLDVEVSRLQLEDS